MKSEPFCYALILGFIASLTAAVLAFTHNSTKERIAYELRQDFLAGLNAVLPEYDNFPDEDALQIDGYSVYTAKKNGQTVGYAVQTVSSKGYSGDIIVVTGSLPDGMINGVTVVKHTETPGLGDKITDAAWLSSFHQDLSTVFAVRSDDGNIDQFSGATISPRAVCDAVNTAAAVLKKAVEAGNE